MYATGYAHAVVDDMVFREMICPPPGTVMRDIALTAKKSIKIVVNRPSIDLSLSLLNAYPCKDKFPYDSEPKE